MEPAIRRALHIRTNLPCCLHTGRFLNFYFHCLLLFSILMFVRTGILRLLASVPSSDFALLHTKILVQTEVYVLLRGKCAFGFICLFNLKQKQFPLSFSPYWHMTTSTATERKVNVQLVAFPRLHYFYSLSVLFRQYLFLFFRDKSGFRKQRSRMQ